MNHELLEALPSAGVHHLLIVVFVEDHLRFGARERSPRATAVVHGELGLETKGLAHERVNDGIEDARHVGRDLNDV